MDWTTLNYETGHKDHQRVIWIRFAYHAATIAEVRQLVGARWSASQRAWYVPDTPAYRILFHLEPQPTLAGDDRLPAEKNGAFKQYLDYLQLAKYSPNTIRTYTSEFRQFLLAMENISIASLSPERLKSYILYCTNELHYSENQLHSRINAIKLYYEKVLGRERMFFNIPRPRKARQLPRVLSTQEVKKLLAATENLKHRFLLAMAYSMGLRVSEVVSLKINDLDLDRNQVFLHAAKGKKDRYANLSEVIKNTLHEYLKIYQPTEYVFTGQYGGKMHVRSAQMMFKNALKKAGINKDLSFHSLRHSYATHLLEYGTDLRFIKELMGHQDIKTTLLYTHVTEKNIRSVKSPLDLI